MFAPRKPQPRQQRLPQNSHDLKNTELPINWPACVANISAVTLTHAERP
jgi:hypothetical protein